MAGNMGQAGAPDTSSGSIVTDDIVPTGRITGISRREDIFDTEAWLNGTAITDIKTFRNYNAFANNSAQLLPKQEFIHTNLGGASAGGLPNAMVFVWYKWRTKINTANADLTVSANVPIWMQVRTIRKETSLIVNFANAKYITCQGDETVGFTDSEFVASTQNNMIAATPNLGGGPNGSGKDVTINGLPREISSLQDFNVEYLPMNIPSPGSSQGGQGPALVSPVCNLYVTQVLGGVLTRGVAA